MAQSSKSHEIYLREWAVALNIPILSIDYSLAPEAPFPRALEEVFYAYCWALKNCKLLGTTAEKVIFAGGEKIRRIRFKWLRIALILGRLNCYFD